MIGKERSIGIDVLVLDFEHPEEVKEVVFDVVYSVLNECKDSCLDAEDFIGTVLKEVVRKLFQSFDSEAKIKEVLYLVIDAFEEFGIDDDYLLKANFLGGIERVYELLRYNFYQFLLAESYDEPPSEMVFEELNRCQLTDADFIRAEIDKKIVRAIGVANAHELVDLGDKRRSMFERWLGRVREASFELVKKMESVEGIKVEIEAFFLRIDQGGDHEKLRNKFVRRFKMPTMRNKEKLLEAYGFRIDEIGENGTDEDICEEIFDKLYASWTTRRPS